MPTTPAPPPPDLSDDNVLVPAGSAQRGLWFAQELDPASAAYLLGHAFELTGTLDVAALSTAFDDVVARHESLRTGFRQWNDELYQVIHASVPPVLTIRDVAAGDVVQAIEDELNIPFALDRPPLLRVRLLRVDRGCHVLIVVLHHIVADGVSVGLLWADLSACYLARRAGTAATLPELPLQYADFAGWEHDWRDSEQYRDHLDAWTKRLTGAPAAIDLPLGVADKVPAWQGGNLTRWLDADVSLAMDRFARQHRVTRLIALLTVFAGVLHRWAGQSDVVVGSPVSLRDQPGLDRVVGPMINSMALRTSWEDDPTATDAVGRVRLAVIDGLTHKQVPFDHLVGALPALRSSGRAPILQVMFAHQDDADHGNDCPILPGVSMRQLPARNNTAKFELSLDCLRDGDQLRCEFEWSGQRLDRELVELFAEHFGKAAEYMVQHANARVGEWPLHDSRPTDDDWLVKFVAEQR